MHCGIETVDLLTEMATQWLRGKEHIQCGDAGKRDDDSHPRQDGGGLGEISSRYSEQHAIENVWIVYFWNFLFNIFWPQLMAGNWNHEKWKHR